MPSNVENRAPTGFRMLSSGKEKKRKLLGDVDENGDSEDAEEPPRKLPRAVGPRQRG